jgi:hydroxymethylpyrimidine pyrophosphatase-like HAD family hydrolase
MLRSMCLCVAISNVDEEVKAATDVVTLSNAILGIAEFD